MSKGEEINGLFETIVELFAVTVLLDDTERDCELIEFTHASLVNNRLLRPDNIVCREILVVWFEENRKRIRDTLASEKAEEYKKSLLLEIEGDDVRKRVLGSIFVIAACDDNLDSVSCEFIRLAMTLWNMDMPTGKELEPVS
ncbi:hypothetical protein [Litorimonas sp.]|uniref:hypothetical protein n=1 Tax=Litorimonas sp. TaxID=1892381 RepID=UPI003A87DE94